MKNNQVIFLMMILRAMEIMDWKKEGQKVRKTIGEVLESSKDTERFGLGWKNENGEKDNI